MILSSELTESFINKLVYKSDLIYISISQCDTATYKPKDKYSLRDIYAISYVYSPLNTSLYRSFATNMIDFSK